MIVDALNILASKGIVFEADIVGDILPLDEKYAEDLKKKVANDIAWMREYCLKIIKVPKSKNTPEKPTIKYFMNCSRRDQK